MKNDINLVLKHLKSNGVTAKITEGENPFIHTTFEGVTETGELCDLIIQNNIENVLTFTIIRDKSYDMSKYHEALETCNRLNAIPNLGYITVIPYHEEKMFRVAYEAKSFYAEVTEELVITLLKNVTNTFNLILTSGYFE